VSGTSPGTSIPIQTTTASSVTIGTILFLTPQISDDGWISMDITPVLTSLKGIESEGGTTAADTETKQASALVRVRNDTTVVLGGLIQTEKDKSNNSVPLLGDIPFFGKVLFSGTYRNKSKTELVIFLTPHIVTGNETSVASPEVQFEMPTNSSGRSMSSH
jgi:type II secretory pathway component GspD/PulD (secretin)